MDTYRPNRRSSLTAAAAALLLAVIAAPASSLAPPELDEALRSELLERVARDQAVRSRDFGSMTTEERQQFAVEAISVDRENTAWLKALVDRIGWPTSALVGDDGAHAAWLLVQHADHDPKFQERCLPLLREAAERGEGSLVSVAYLTDRVRVKQGLPQLYGTQYDVVVDANGEMQYQPPLVEDPAHLDDRRRAVGLPPWREYEAQMAALQEREPFDAPRGAEAPAAATTMAASGAPWPMTVASAALERLGRDGYLASVLDLLDREDEALAADDMRTTYLDVLATRLAFVGEHNRAMRRGDEAYGRVRPVPDDAVIAELLATHRPVPALPAIVEAARDRRIVMVNEEHRSSVQRAFTNRLLAPLRNAGFTHLAVETIHEDPVSLRDRGYPTLASGTYTRDPVFGDLIRRALELGYVIVGYDASPDASAPRPDDSSPADAMNRRERAQAEHIVERILTPAPDARVLVIGGRDHIAESTGEWTPMGGILKSLTGIDPLTLNLYVMVEHSRREHEHWAFRAVDEHGWLASDEPILLRATADDALWSRAPGALDAYVFHPRTRLVNGRPSWMSMGGLRRQVAIDEFPASDEPMLLQAVLAGESDDAVPVDLVVWWPGTSPRPFMLRPGEYVVRMIDRDGIERYRAAMRVHESPSR